MKKIVKITGIGLACCLGAVATPTLINHSVNASVHTTNPYLHKTEQQIQTAVLSELRREESNQGHVLSNTDIKRVLQNMFPGDVVTQTKYFNFVMEKLQSTHLSITQIATNALHHNTYTYNDYDNVFEVDNSYEDFEYTQPNPQTLHQIQLERVLNDIETQTNKVGRYLTKTEIRQVIAKIFPGHPQIQNEFFDIVTR